MLTGSVFPIDIIEKLDDPVDVEGWSAEGLQLANGRTVQLPGFSALPEECEALKVATERGVEISDDGRLIGLVDLWHWCGNDPVRNHIVRVDLAYLLMYVQEGEYAATPVEPEFSLPVEHRSNFTEYGWDTGTYYSYQQFAGEQ